MKRYTKEEFARKWPMNEIPDCIRECAVAWANAFDYLSLEDTVKLARDMLEATEKYKLEYAKQQVVSVLKWVTDEKSPFAIMYGDQEQRFADNEREYTPEEVYSLFIEDQNKLNE
jgi:hypothetical protein